MSPNKHQKKIRHPRANELAMYRVERQLSRKEVKQLLGLHALSSVSRFEEGRILPTLITALKFEILYRHPVAFLFPELYLELRRQLREKEAATGRLASEEVV